jgi:hypothetical protein
MWRFWWTAWTDVGLYGIRGDEKFNLGFGTPLGGFSVTGVIELPNEKLLVNLGRDQICLVDIMKRKIEQFGKGYGIFALHRDQIAP